MTNKYEYWRNQTLVNRTSSNNDIACEYYILAMFVIDNYKDRMETIQNPLLHIISHCLELKFKDIIIFALKNNYIEGDLDKVVHDHSFYELLPYILKIFHNISNEQCCSPDDKKYFTTLFPANIAKIVNILRTDTTTYRYAEKLDKKGNFNGSGHPFVIDGESANIINLKILFEDCYYAISYTSYILDYIFPQQ